MLAARDGSLVQRLSKLDDKAVAEELYLAVLTRPPTEKSATRWPLPRRHAAIAQGRGAPSPGPCWPSTEFHVEPLRTLASLRPRGRPAMEDPITDFARHREHQLPRRALARRGRRGAPPALRGSAHGLRPCRGRGPQEEAEAGPLRLARRRHEPARKLGPQAEHASSAGRSAPSRPRPRHPRLRAAAADREADAPPGHRPQPVHARTTRTRPASPASSAAIPKNRGVTYPVLRLGRGQAPRPRRQRAAALCLDQAEQRRLHLPGRRLPRPQVRRPGLRRRQAAGEPAAAPSRVTPRTTTSATTCAQAADQRYAESRRKESTEANSYVFDMAAQLHEAAGPVRRVDSSPPRTSSATARTSSAGTCCMARRMLEAGVTLREGQLLRLGHARRQLQRPPEPGAEVRPGVRRDDRGPGRPRHARQRAGDRDVASSAARRGSTATSAATTGRKRGRWSWPAAASSGASSSARPTTRAPASTSDEHDIGHLFHTWFRALGIDPQKTEYDNDGQPLPIAHEEMQAVKEAPGVNPAGKLGSKPSPPTTSAAYYVRSLRLQPRMARSCAARTRFDGTGAPLGSRRTSNSMPLPPLTGHDGWVHGHRLSSRPDSGCSPPTAGVSSAPGPLPTKLPNRCGNSTPAHDGWIRARSRSAADGQLLATCGTDQESASGPPDGSQVARAIGPQRGCLSRRIPARRPVAGLRRSPGDVKRGMSPRQEDRRGLRRHGLLHADRVQDVGGVRGLASSARARCCRRRHHARQWRQRPGHADRPAFDSRPASCSTNSRHGAGQRRLRLRPALHPAGFLMAVTSGNPGNGKFLPGRRPGRSSFTKMPNCHSLALHPDGRALCRRDQRAATATAGP